jgi:hypothetical protein
VKDNKGIRGGEFDDVSFSITMRATGFENSFGSISYVPQPVINGLLFFGENRLSRIPISSCLTAVPVYLTDKDIGAFGICKWKVNNRYICTNAHNQIVTLDLNDGVYLEVAASTYVASKTCLPNCSECS